MTSTILHDFKSGKFFDCTFKAYCGLLALQQAARVTRPISYVGFSKLAQLVSTLFPSDSNIRAQLSPDTIFEYPYADRYWARLACNGDVYTRDVESFLRAISHVDYAFIDCGANYGYMSVIATSAAYGNKPSIAIEADPETFQKLVVNAKLNDNRFEIRHNAVFSKSGVMVNITGEKHEARSMINRKGNMESGDVETITLDSLRPWVDQQNKAALMLKLDVEGVEIEAMKGASTLPDFELAVLFEDHGSEKDHAVTRYFIEDQKMRVFLPGPDGCREILNPSELDAIKRNPRRGYDFVATKSEYWLTRIAGLSY